ncbi:PQQ-binding-like beta-propeller repeat protein, partial [Candidatus Latescibacterota bacterium]
SNRGICVVLGDENCGLSVDLAGKSELLIYVQIASGEDMEAACSAVDAAGYYGTRIFIEKGGMSKIHMADNLADIVVDARGSSGVSDAEVLRVLRPEGRALLGKRELVKSFPEGIDDWSHPYHSPDNNPQSNDIVARAPYLTQFLEGPFYAPMPQNTVSSAGRVFRALGHIAFKPREENCVNKIMAYNGYNGTILWSRELDPGIMVHRNTMIATPDILYLGDKTSCKLIDTVTGETKGEIVPPEDVAGGTFWKWMALENEVLYSVIGEQEMQDPEVRNSNPRHGWPWTPLSKGFNLPENPWGFGRNILAIDTKTKNVLWSYREDEPVDTRAVCMKNGKLFAFRFGSYLTCLDSESGEVIWRKSAENDPELFDALGNNLNRQDWQTNWRTTSYLKCSDKALYFAGPMMDKLITLSVEDGSVMWTHPYDNFQLVLRDDGLYGISGPWVDKLSKKFDPLTGEILAEYELGRRACTMPTGTADAIFFRADGGSIRLDVASSRPQYVSPMRPTCFDGVTVANGLLYWWPSVCDCQLTLYGATCLGPAGDHDFYARATVSERLEKGAGSITEIVPLDQSPADWATFRGNNQCNVTTDAVIPGKSTLLWKYTPDSAYTPTAPITAGGLIFVGGSDGIIRAIDSSTGEKQRISPTVWNGRLFAGSGDGWVYSFEAKTGRMLWRFRAAPMERKIPVYGKLLSTWPAASGVIVEDGIAYVAAGISNFDGTYVYALDAVTGDIKWENNTSGHLNAEARTGVGVQGHLLLNGEKLYMAGGNAVSPAVYDIADGTCFNNGDLLNISESICLRGCELFLIGDKVAAGGQPFYCDPEYPVIDATVTEKVLHTSSGGNDIIWKNNNSILCYTPIDKKVLNDSVYDRVYPQHYVIPPWGKLEIDKEPVWAYECGGSVAAAVCSNAVLVALKSDIFAVDIKTGGLLWNQKVQLAPVDWGMAVDSAGRTVVSCEDGSILCFGQGG